MHTVAIIYHAKLSEVYLLDGVYSERIGKQ